MSDSWHTIIRRIELLLRVFIRWLETHLGETQPKPVKPPNGDDPASPDKPGEKALVTRVIDGDTFEVHYEDGGSDIVRMLGMDTPEVSRRFQDPREFGIPDTRRGREWLFMWGGKATEYTTDVLTPGKSIRLETDEQAGVRDPYDRLLAYVHVEDTTLNEELLKRGLARVYTGETFAREEAYLAIEDEAKYYERGIWGFDA